MEEPDTAERLSLSTAHLNHTVVQSTEPRKELQTDRTLLPHFSPQTDKLALISVNPVTLSINNSLRD